MWHTLLFLIIYLFRKCLSRKTCRDGTFHISLAPGTTALEKKTQPLHHPSLAFELQHRVGNPGKARESGRGLGTEEDL